MTKEQTAKQLRLAAEIIETGHPWEWWHISDQKWNEPNKEMEPHSLLTNSTYQIRLALATPPDGRPLHNPDNLTAEQVGTGFRLGLPDESAYQAHEYWEGEWFVGTPQSVAFGSFKASCRIPLSTPWPEVEKPDPEYIDLGPEDVPPGSVFRHCYWFGSLWFSVSKVSDNGVSLADDDTYPWETLRNEWHINRSIPLTGKWDANAWEWCKKVRNDRSLATAGAGLNEAPMATTRRCQH